MIITGGAGQVRDFHWLKRNIPEGARCIATDVTSGIAVLGVQGPKARALLQSITNADLTNEAFPFGHSREIELGYAIVRASRITYMGELGWELYMPTEFATGVYDAIIGAGDEYGLKHVGMHAMNSLRIE
jgi:4-methylaminobutanoate oxidase (formaldehyde-forming)